MDLGTLIRALSPHERQELLDRLASETEEGSAGDTEDGVGCCGGAGPRARRRARSGEMRHSCCGG